MSERWRVTHRYATGQKCLAEVREGGPEGGSRFVCEATVPDAEAIVAAVNAVNAEDRRGPAQEVERLRAALMQAGCDLTGWLGYAERRGWAGTTSSLQRALDRIHAALSGGSAVPEGEPVALSINHLTDAPCQNCGHRCEQHEFGSFGGRCTACACVEPRFDFSAMPVRDGE